MKKISKFDCYIHSISCEWYHFAVFNAQKYTIEDIKKIIPIEVEHEDIEVVFGDQPGQFQINRCFVKWSVGHNEDAEPCVGWLEHHKRISNKGNVPCYGVRLLTDDDVNHFKPYVQPEFIDSDLILKRL